uniref:HTH_Tnp_Tc3_1 domain-containing protein n=1 Tax=Caenorhabditis japonica TaxID=281687 RepID=A0A8R1EJI5_CAEJA
MSRQLGRSRNTIRRFVNNPINYGKKQKLPQTTQNPLLPIGKRRESRLQHYKELVCFETKKRMDLRVAIKAERDAITEAELTMLVARMPNRVIKVTQKNGGDINY